jgi:uncharacterized protein YndB with AHSA1/START domain
MKRIDSARTEIPAPAHRIYRAFAQPGAMERWLPPDGMTGEMLAFDFREGGGYRMRLRYDDPRHATGKSTADTDDVSARITGLVPDERIVQAVTFESDDPRFAGEMTLVWRFTPAADGTLVEVRAEHVPEGISAEDHEEGLRSTLQNLAAFVRDGS